MRSSVTTTSGTRWTGNSAIICVVLPSKSAFMSCITVTTMAFARSTRNKPIEKPEDLKGFKIRLPVAPAFIELFKHLGASPAAINFGEVYSALQTGVVDGQENPLILIDTAKLYEVQKYCSMTNHLWVGLHVSF